MAIKVTFKQGQTEAKATPLHQWDYGQVLEIESSDLPAVFEVHFACQGMNEATVRSCTAVGGIGTVVVPDRCLEQSTTITAWVYAIQGTTGTTIKTITIPVVARTRPSRGDEVIPPETTDRYNELISEVNEVVGELTNGNVTAAKAKNAEYAVSAGNATSAGYATSSGKADSSNTAKKAELAQKAYSDELGNPIHSTYASFANEFKEYTPGAILLGGIYQVILETDYGSFCAIIPVTSEKTIHTPLGFAFLGDSYNGYAYVLRSYMNKLSYRGETPIWSDTGLYIRKIG